MNKNQYEALCKVCDQFLLDPQFGDELVAIPWLHIIRPHPFFLKNYTDLFETQSFKNSKRRARNILSTLYRLGRAFAIGGEPWSCASQLPHKSDLLIVSHLINKSFIGEETDFYYDKTACQLVDQGLSVTIALINYTEVSPVNLARSWKQSKVPRVIFNPVLAFADECKLYKRVSIAARHLRSITPLQFNNLERKIMARAAIEVSSGASVSALRMGEQVKALVARLQPKAIMVTYEGHSWERIAFAAARSISPRIRCIGYQHATLFNQQHALQRQLASKYNPNTILTSGNVAQTLLQKNPQLQGLNIKTMGSNRSFLRQPMRLGPSNKGEFLVCLVIPEGIMSECNLLFGFALECARLVPGVKFIWRIHPSMSYEELAKKNKIFRNLPSNIILSENTLGEDINQSHWALYRGSTAIVQAVVSGLRAIYLHCPGEISIDTLFEVSDLHATVVNPKDFKVLISNFNKNNEGVESEARIVQDYCQNIFMPIDIRSLVSSITEDL